MTFEEGVVLYAKGKTARVKTTKSEACESCSAKSSCHSLGGGKDMEVEALNPAGAKPGDQVMIGFETASLYKATFLMYVFPILALLGGAFLGAALAPAMGLGESAAAALVGFIFFGIAFVVVRLTATRLSAKTSYRPKIIRIISTASDMACDPV